MTAASIELVVGPEHDGARLDRFLADRLEGSGTSRSLLQKHIEAGAVTVDGAAPKHGSRTAVRRGALVRYVAPAPEPIDLVAEDIPLAILYEDDDLIAIDKPKGLVVHPAAGHRRGTLVNALLHHVRGMERLQEDLRPGIVHRLDRGTTGVMIVAKNPEIQRRLVRAFQTRKIAKRYLAVVRGVPSEPSGTFDTLYGRHPRDRKRFTSRVADGKRAITHFRVAERFLGAALVEVDLETGRTHQIRVHFAESGHPLIGDDVYGRRRGKSADPRIASILAELDRPALHALRLELAHPRTGEPLVFEAPVPADLVALIEALRAASKGKR